MQAGGQIFKIDLTFLIKKRRRISASSLNASFFPSNILSWGNFDKNAVTLINKDIRGKMERNPILVLFETRFWDDIKFQDNDDHDAIWNIDPWIACLHGQISVIEFYPFRMKLQIWSRNFHHFISSIIIGNWPIKMHLLWEDILSLFLFRLLYWFENYLNFLNIRI